MKTLKELAKKIPATIELRGDKVFIIDQTLLPNKFQVIELVDYQAAIKSITSMQIRGAQAIGAAGAAGVWLAARNSALTKADKFVYFLESIAKKIIAARPTAINLAWAVKKMLSDLPKNLDVADLKVFLWKRYFNLLESEKNNNIKLGEFGNQVIKNNSRILTHCNAGSLSSIWFGTATAPIFTAVLNNKKIKVLADETRPWLQGSRLTAWEMDRAGIDYQVQIDSACGYLMSHGLVDMVIVGADHIAANGDTANKIGTYPLALMAHEHKVPFYVAAVTATIDFKIKTGADIKIEVRESAEVLSDIKYKNQAISPKKAKTFNPVFDVTPAKYITGIITEKGIIKPSLLNKLK